MTTNVLDNMNEALIALGYTTGSLEDKLSLWATDNGGVGSTLNDKIYTALVSQGATGNNVNDLWMSALFNIGYTQNNFIDRVNAFWLDGGNFFAFFAPLTDSVVPTTGTFSSFTGDDGDATITDFEGLVKDTQAEEVRFKGARRVENLLTNIHSDQFITGFDLSSVTKIDDHTVELVAVKSVGISQWYLPNIIPASVSFCTISFEIMLVSNDESFSSFGVYNGYTSTTVDLKDKLSVGEWVQVCPEVGVSKLGTNGSFGFLAAGGGNYTVRIRNILAEDVTGQANQNPSEYVSVGVGTEPELFPDTGFDNETDWIFNGGTFDTSDKIFKKIPSGVQIYVNDLGSSVGSWFSLSGVENVTNTENDKLYAVELTIENYSLSPTASISVGAYLGETDPSPNTVGVTGNGVYTIVKRGVGAVAGATNVYPHLSASATSGGFAGCDLVNISIKEIQHGSNVDGVKYFDTLNYNTVTDNVVSTLPAPAGAGVQQLVDPEFDDDVVIPSFGTGVDFSSGLGVLTVTGGELEMVAGSVALSVFTPEAGKYYRIEYEITLSDITSSVGFGGLGLNKAVGVYDVIVKTSMASVFSAVNVGGSTTNIKHVRITPLTHIPEDILEGVLVEEQSENLLNGSEDFVSGTYWTTITALDTVANNEVAPDGKSTADTIDDGVITSSLHRLYRAYTFTTTSVAISVYAKAGTNGRWFKINIYDGTSAIHVNFDLSGSGAIGNETIGSGYIEAVGDNGWFRCVMTAPVAAAAGNLQIQILDSDNISGTPSHDGANRTIHLWGAQLEALPYPTSCIPTAGSTVIRSKDVLQYEPPAVLTGSAVNDFVITGEITMPFDGADLVGSVYLFDYRDATSFDRIRAYFSSDRLYIDKIDATGSNKAISNVATNFIAGSTYKFAFRIGQSGTHMFIGVNGGTGVVQTTSDPTATNLDFANTGSMFIASSYLSSLHSNIPIKNLKVHEGDLSDAKCVELTS